jgi:hypothetical protein
MSVPSITVRGMWTWPVVLSTALASVALVVAIGTLAWQIVSWRRSGPRVKVTARPAVTADGGRLIVIEAVNSGRLGTEIQGCGFDLPSGTQIVCPYNFWGRVLQWPKGLGPGSTVDFHFKPRDVLEPLIGERVTGDGTRAYVRTGHGRVRGKPFHLGEMIKALTPSATGGHDVT